MAMGITKSVYSGIDYLRLTALDHSPVSAWEAIVLPEFLAEERAGRKPHWRWLLGYYGRVGEHCFVGKSDTGAMIQLSGALAWSRWHDASLHSKRCTRIDLQVTFPCEAPADDILHDAFMSGSHRKFGRGKPPEIQIVDTNYGAKMLTIGSRQSELYGRMYDKYKESKMPEYKDCIRWEVEVKGKEALDLHGWMLDNKNEPTAVRSLVHHFWEARGMTPPWGMFDGMDVPVPVKRSKTDETKLAWIATQVRPSMKDLIDKGKAIELARSIAGRAVTNEQLEELARLLEIVCGD